MSRKFWILTVVLGATALALAVRVSIACACTPPLNERATPVPSLGRAFRDIAVAQESIRRNSGHYSDRAMDFAAVRLPPQTRLVTVAVLTRSYRVRVDSGGATGRSCLISGGLDSLGVAQPFEL